MLVRIGESDGSRLGPVRGGPAPIPERLPAREETPQSRGGEEAGVVVRLSPRAAQLLGEGRGEPESELPPLATSKDSHEPRAAEATEHAGTESSEPQGTGEPASPGAKPSGQQNAPQELSKEEREQVQELQKRDAEVRAHEAAHQSGGMAGAASFTYETGPDGKRYAVGGEVPIDMSPGRTPEETISKARAIRAAALAPANPSGQDRSIAAAASQMESQAQQAASERRRAEMAAAMKGADAPAAPEAQAARPSAKAEPRDGAARGPAEQREDSRRAGERAESDYRPDPNLMLATLKSERVTSYGGFGHQHVQTGCGFCKRAASSY